MCITEEKPDGYFVEERKSFSLSSSSNLLFFTTFHGAGLFASAQPSAILFLVPHVQRGDVVAGSRGLAFLAGTSIDASLEDTDRSFPGVMLFSYPTISLILMSSCIVDRTDVRESFIKERLLGGAIISCDFNAGICRFTVSR